jgi:hypothetical protein
MKKLFYLMISIILLSCTPKVIVDNNIFQGSSMKNDMNGKYSVAQFDSMCIADTLPRNLDDWENIGLKDYETKEKTMLFSANKKNVIYKVEKICDDSVKIIKRVVK